jgi:flagellar assembly factor FliW
MIVNTLSFGELEIDPQEVYEFSQGIPGFEEYHHYVIIQPEVEQQFCYIQSIEESGLALLVCNPFVYFKDYDFQISEMNLNELKIKSEGDVTVWSVVTINWQKNEASMNLLAPIVVNIRERLGKQIILHDSEYRTKHKLTFPNSEEIIKMEG